MYNKAENVFFFDYKCTLVRLSARKRVRQKMLAIEAELLADKAKRGRLTLRNPGAPKASRVDTLFNDAGAAVTSAEDKKTLVQDFYTELFTDPSGNALPSWVDHKFGEADLANISQIDGDLVRSVILEFAKGKTCADDNVVIEMLQAFKSESMEAIAQAFKKRIMNRGKQEDKYIWAEHLVKLIKKRASATRVPLC